MPVQEKGFTPQDLGALGIGLGVMVVSSLTIPLPPPLNVAIGIALGGAAVYGSRKVLDPRTPKIIIDEENAREFRKALAEIEAVKQRIEVASLRPCAGTASAARLMSIAARLDMLLQRHRERPPELPAVTKTDLLAKTFDEVLGQYMKVKCGEIFLDKQEASEFVEQTERKTLPMFDEALERLLTQMDSGQKSAVDVQQATLEDMLRALDLIRSLRDKTDEGGEEGADDTHK